jgi:hypothetical protein
MTFGFYGWCLVVTQLWGNFTGTVNLMALYPTREACQADKRYWEFNSPEKRVYAECKAVRIADAPSVTNERP